MHPNEQTLSAAYDAFAKGDLASYLALCADDIEFHVPGTTPFSGVHTKADFPQWMAGVMEIAHRTNHVYEFRDGLFSRWEEWPASEEAFNESWS